MWASRASYSYSPSHSFGEQLSGVAVLGALPVRVGGQGDPSAVAVPGAAGDGRQRHASVPCTGDHEVTQVVQATGDLVLACQPRELVRHRRWVHRDRPVDRIREHVGGGGQARPQGRDGFGGCGLMCAEQLHEATFKRAMRTASVRAVRSGYQGGSVRKLPV